MSKPSPTSGRRPAVLPKRSSLAANADTDSPPGSPPLLAKRPYAHMPPSPKTPLRSPIGRGEKGRLVPEMQPPLPSVGAAAQTDKFGKWLQSAREQINARHQGELQVMEGFRNYAHRRAKADGEYVAALAKIHSQAAREVNGVGTNSSIGKVWNGFLEAMESIQTKISSVSKQVEGTLMSTFDRLIKEKKGLKRAYDISRSQLDDEYHTSSNDVQNNRRKYIQLLQVTENSKRKLEETLKKPNAKPDEIEKLRVKYVKSAQKLHTCHNDYTFSLLNINCHTKHYYTSMLPFCLDTLQERMEAFVAQWKELMEEYALTMDISKVYQESFRMIFTNVESVKPEQEYQSFIQENRRDPVDEEEYIFDTALLQGYCSPKVQANQLSINNLTHENVVADMAESEQKLEEWKKEYSEKKQRLEGLMVETGADEKTQIPKAVLISNLQAELRSLDYGIEREKLKLSQLKGDLGEMNDKCPLFDPLGQNVLVTMDQSIQNDRHNSADTGSGKVIKQKLKGIMAWINQRSHSQSSETNPVSAEVQDKDNEDYDNNYDNFEPGVEAEPWYYNDLERREAEMKCRNTGDYLIRYSSKQNRYILTVNWAGQGRHFIVQQSCNVESKTTLYYFESHQFSSIRELIDFHIKSQTPITMASGAIVTKPVLKDDKWLLSPGDITKTQDLGKGAFGDVYEAEWKGLRVAVKVCRSSDVYERNRFLQEAEILKHYDHPNVVKLVGFCWSDEPLIVMELMIGGSLLKYLKKQFSNCSKTKLLHFAIDACCGMKYLETKSCIHRDLAARNCLVGDNDIVKISDFGMSHDACESYQMQGTKQIPIKWTAPEALNSGHYTLASDIWSFGVLLWEIFSGGAAPYPGISNVEAKGKIDEGYRMPSPAGCPETVYDTMMLCWQYEPESRPNFADLHDLLIDISKGIK